MADDRVFLRRKVCNEEKMLIKYWSGHASAAEGSEIQEWIDRHLKECYIENEEAREAILGMTLGRNTLFDLVTEEM